jgi:dephospho-CoA kinase
MLKVGLTGGIGSGKSEVGRMLAARGAVVIDADRIAREVVASGTPGLAAVVEAFGSSMLTEEGELDRPRMAALVFSDEAARQRLNAIVHPLVAARAAELEAALPPHPVVVYDVPLLVENSLESRYDVVVVVEAPLSVRLDRLTRLRRMDVEAAQARIASQASDEERRRVADIVIDNGGPLSALREAVGALWQDLVTREAAAGERGASP